MNNEQRTMFFKAMMTGLFIGIVDTVICLVYNILYRNYTGYTPSAIVNVSSLILIVNLLLLIIGMFYYVFLRIFRKADGIYMAVFFLITAFLTWKSVQVVRFDISALDNGFRGLLGGIVAILGISATCLPLLYRNKAFLDHII